jgi:glycosyltransferase involved in cell wall biosynthesis
VLYEAVDSVLTQNYPATNFEFIIVDHGSTDNTKSGHLILNNYDDEQSRPFQKNLKAMLLQNETISDPFNHLCKAFGTK